MSTSVKDLFEDALKSLLVRHRFPFSYFPTKLIKF